MDNLGTQRNDLALSEEFSNEEVLSFKNQSHLFTFVDLFSGIGGFHQAAISQGGKCVFACEIDDQARQAYEANYHIKPYGDITQLNPTLIPNHDMLFAGFPCQPFSIIGKQEGFDDHRGNLFFEIIRIVKIKEPPILILENVKQLATHQNGKTFEIIQNELENLGYNIFWSILNALDFGLPQKRERLIIVGFKNRDIKFNFPKKLKQKLLQEVLLPDEQIDKKYYASPTIINKRMLSHKSNYDLAIWHENKSGNISSYPYSCALRAGASYNYLLVNGKRRLTPREMLRLQGFDDSFKMICNDSQTRKQAGNAVPVSMIKEVIKEVIRATKT